MGSHFGWLVNSPPTFEPNYFSGEWDVHWGYGVLTHGHIYIYIYIYIVCLVIIKSYDK